MLQEIWNSILQYLLNPLIGSTVCISENEWALIFPSHINFQEIKSDVQSKPDDIARSFYVYVKRIIIAWMLYHTLLITLHVAHFPFRIIFMHYLETHPTDDCIFCYIMINDSTYLTTEFNWLYWQRQQWIESVFDMY